ncbi:hypothetical protein ABIA32_002716 [Streptacidiphilus sp. MAP12-20]|uniref:hypothetical protein n=1 Tax=Streptacidiphilus sp. MAP12-20 TaxID=3156299 RepID=UPI003511BEB7
MKTFWPVRIARVLGWTVVLGAAFAFTTWSLFSVAHGRYGVPAVLSGFAGAVYDGAALLALDAWSSAAADPRQSTLRPRIVAVALLTTSIYLNVTHATWQHQGPPAAVLFAAPGMVLWAMAELRLGARHASARHQLGLGFAPRRAYGVDAWVVRRGRAWRAYTAHLDARLDHALPAAETAREVLLGRELEAGDADLMRGDAPQVSGPRPATLAAAIMAAASAIGADAQPADIAELIGRNHGLDLDLAYVRTVLSRAKKDTDGEPDHQPAPAKNGPYL